MALDDEVEVDWASYIFASLLESVHRYRTVKKSKNFVNDVHFGLLVNYLLEQKISQVDRGEELADSDYLPYKNTSGKIKIAPSAGVPTRLPKLAQDKGERKRDDADKNDKSESSFDMEYTKGIKLPVSPSSSATHEETRKTKELFQQMERAMLTGASPVPKRKKSTSSKPLTRSVVHHLRDDP